MMLIEAPVLRRASQAPLREPRRIRDHVKFGDAPPGFEFGTQHAEPMQPSMETGAVKGPNIQPEDNERKASSNEVDFVEPEIKGYIYKPGVSILYLSLSLIGFFGLLTGTVEKLFVLIAPSVVLFAVFGILALRRIAESIWAHQKVGIDENGRSDEWQAGR